MQQPSLAGLYAVLTMPAPSLHLEASMSHCRSAIVELIVLEEHAVRNRLRREIDELKTMRSLAREFGNSFGFQALMLDFVERINQHTGQMITQLMAGTNQLLLVMRSDCESALIKMSVEDRQRFEVSTAALKKTTFQLAKTMASKTSSTWFQYMLDNLDEKEKKMMQEKAVIKMTKSVTKGLF